MSVIWDSLREAEQSRSRTWERRSTARSRLHIPLLVYGHTIQGEAFHEPTEASYFNAAGGLITLSMAVTCGQRLLLLNRLNTKERECLVIGRRSQYLNCATIAVGFLSGMPDFWREANSDPY